MRDGAQSTSKGERCLGKRARIRVVLAVLAGSWIPMLHTLAGMLAERQTNWKKNKSQGSMKTLVYACR